jgi:hypothetical protein
VIEPSHDISTAISPRGAGRTADTEVDLFSGQMEVFGNLATRLSGADDENRFVGEGFGIFVGGGMELPDLRGQALG